MHLSLGSTHGIPRLWGSLVHQVSFEFLVSRSILWRPKGSCFGPRDGNMASSSVLAPQLRSQHNLHIESLPVLLAVTAAWLSNRRVHTLIISIHFTLCSNQSWPVYFTANFAMFSLILLVWCLVSVFFCQCSFPESLARGFPYRTDTVLLPSGNLT